MNFIVKFFSEYWIYIIASSVLAYLISSINTSIIVTRIVKHEDIRKMGSGNAGFTNVLRCVGKIPAIITFVGDFMKGILSVLIPYFLLWGAAGDGDLYRGMLMYVAGFFAVMGHMFPLYNKFKGGKGVVTTASIMIVTDWRVLVVELLIFAVFFILTKTISKCSLICAGCYPIVTLILRVLDHAEIIPEFLRPTKYLNSDFTLFITIITLAIGVIIIIKHKENIKRILNGTEKKITEKNKAS